MTQQAGATPHIRGPVSSQGASWPRIARQVMPHDRLDAVRDIIETELRAVHQDYFGRADFQRFLAQHVYPDGRYLLMVQYRAIFRGIVPLLLNDKLVALARSHFTGQPGFLNVTFVRMAFPDGGSRGPKRLDNYTYGPLHWDNYDNLPTLTFWIPLNDIDASTGGLVWTHDDTVMSMIGGGMGPATYHKEGAASGEFVRLLKSRSTQVTCEKGDVVYFDRTLLHGSTYSAAKPRVTVDLRLVDSACDKAQPAKHGVRSRIVELGRLDDAKIQSFIELMRLGDVRFTQRHPAFKRKYWLHGVYPWVGGIVAGLAVLYLGSRRRMRAILRSRWPASARERLRRSYSQWFVLGTHWHDFLEAALRAAGADKVVLDAGSGESPHARRFRQCKQYIGIDLRRLDSSAPSVIGDLSRLPLCDAVVDVILCTQVLEHTQDPQQVLAEFFRVLKPGGQVFLSVPLIWPEHRQPMDFFRYTKFGLQHLLQLAKFETVELLPMGGFFSVCRLVWNDLWSAPQSSGMMRYTYRAAFPIFWFMQAFGRWILAPICHGLDRLNSEPAYTIGYFCSARKPQIQHTDGSAAPLEKLA